MAGTQLTCSVVICAYTEARWEELTAAVTSVREQSTSPLDIIVVIDHNVRLLERARMHFADVVVVENQQGRGLSGARNSGIAEARGDIIAFLDDDAIAAPDWLEQLAAGYDHPTVMGVGGKIAPIWQSGKPGWFPEEFGWVVGCTYRGMPETSAQVRNLIGANMSFRREVFAAVGVFRIGRVGALSIGQENDETEFCIRLAATCPDAEIWYEPAAAVRHTVPPNRTTLAYFARRCFSEGLSKARLSHQVGHTRGLSAERTYTLRTLPLGVLRGVVRAMGGNLSGLGQAAAIVAGLGITVVGYARGRMGTGITTRHTHRDRTQQFAAENNRMDSGDGDAMSLLEVRQ